MSRRALLTRFVAALVGIVAVAAAAATVTSPSDPVEPGGAGEGSGEGGGVDLVPVTDVQPGSQVSVPFVEYLVALVLVLVAAAGAWYLITHRRDALKIVAVTLVVTSLVGGSFYMFMGGEFEMESGDVGLGEPGGGGGFGGEPGAGGESDTLPFDVPIIVLALAVAVAIVVGAFVVSGERDPPEGRRESDDEPDAEATAVGAAAGRAADRIDASGEDVPVDNEVYRAWREMTRLLDVDSPETSTPGEFASAAIEAGIARDHVDELTRLFEDARYGDVETTPEMESRAVSVLRRIEDAYAAEATPGQGGENA